VIIDTSAMVAIANEEAGYQALLDAMSRNAWRLRVSAATYVETGIVLDRTRDPVVSRRLDELLAIPEVEIVPVTASQARGARAAYRDYGRGSGLPAKLNVGDVFAYALAAETGEPAAVQRQ
jgi:ribonuclease VapC